MPRTSDPGLSVQQLQLLLRRRQNEIEGLHRKRESLERRLQALDRRINELEGNGVHAGAGPQQRARNPKGLASVMEDILRESGKPMSVGEIVDAVLKSGYKTNSASFRSIVNQMLIKDERFTSPKRTFYQLKK